MQVFQPPNKIQLNNTRKYGYVSFGTQTNKFFAQAPITGISIQQSVDYSINKNLAGNFDMLVFQSHPVVIRIQGIQIIAYYNCENDKSLTPTYSQSNIQKLYQEATAGLRQNNKKPLTITVAGDVYKAVIVHLRRQSFDKFNGTMSFDLTLYGVKI